MSQEARQSDVDWSYKVLENLRDGFNAVASKPELKGDAVLELFIILPDVFDAILSLVKEEHIGVVRDVIGAAVRAFKE